MKYTLYKPNSKVTGCAGSFDVVQSGKDLKTTLYVSMIKQSSWDDQKKTGTFKGNKEDASKTINFKLNAEEAGEMLSSIQTRTPFVAFHKFNDDTTVIRFTPWDKNRKIKGKNGEEIYISAAWGLSVTRNSSETFQLPIEAGESQVLSILLKQFIEDVLFENAQNQSTEKAKNSSAPVREPKKAEVVEEEDDDDDDDDDDVPF